MADEFDNLVEQIVLDDSQALQALANFATSLTTAQEKVAGLQTLIDAVAAKIGGDFDAAKQKVLDFNAAIEAMPQVTGGTKGFDPANFDQVTSSAQKMEGAFLGDAAALGKLTSQKDMLAAFWADIDETNKRIMELTPMEQEQAKVKQWLAGLDQVEKKQLQVAESSKVMGEATPMPQWMQSLQSFTGFDTARGKIDALKLAVTQYSQENGVSFDKAATAVKKAGEEMGVFTNQTNKYMLQGLKELQTESMGVTGELEKLGTMFVRVWTAMLAFQVVQWVMQLFTGFKQAVAAGLEFANTMNLVVVAVRNLQSMGMDVTLQQVNEQITALKKQFPIFTEQDIASGFKDLLLKTSSMNLTFQDTVRIMQIAMGTSLLMGKTVEQTSDAIIKGMINVNKQSVKSVNDITSLYVSQQDVVRKAGEMGIENAKNGYTAMTEQEKALAYLNAAYDEYIGKQKDIEAITGTTTMQAQTLGATWSDAKKNLGLLIEELPAFKAALEFLNYIIPVLTAATVTLFSVMLSGFELMLTPLALVYGYFTGLTAATMNGTNLWDKFKAGVEGATLAVRQLLDLVQSTSTVGLDAIQGKLPSPASPLGNNPIGPIIPGETTGEDLTKIAQDAEEEIIRIRDESAAKQEQIERDKNEKLEDLALKHARAMEDLAIDEVNKTNEIKIDTANDIAKANDKARERDIEAEQKYQLQMKELRENFMLSLQEALRSNDARSIIRLIGQYDLEKKQAADKYALDTELRHKADAEEIEDINRQEQIKLAELHREIQERRDALNRQYEQEKVDVETWRQRQLADLEKETNDRLKMWSDMLLAQHKLTKDNIDLIYADLKAAFGKNGTVDQLYSYLLARMIQMQQMAAGVARSLGGEGFGGRGGGGEGQGSSHGYANGGTLFADTPKTVTFGEAGPEVAMFIPLRSSLGTAPSSLINVGGGAGGSLQLSLLLSPELEARIIQTSLANVALSIDRMQRQQ